MEIIEVSKDDDLEFQSLVDMAYLLWSHHSKEDLAKEMIGVINSEKEFAFVGKENGDYISFLTLSLKYEYVQGASSYPVGYVEGIYVKQEFRRKGFAKELIKFAEKELKEKGCKELASDTRLWNQESQRFHKNLGFDEVDTIVHFIKKIDS